MLRKTALLLRELQSPEVNFPYTKRVLTIRTDQVIIRIERDTKVRPASYAEAP